MLGRPTEGLSKYLMKSLATKYSTTMGSISIRFANAQNPAPRIKSFMP